MKNFINRALVAKKHLKLFFALFAMLALGVGNAWAEEVTFDATSDKGSTSTGAVSFEKDGITLSAENGALGNGTDYRIYKNTKLTISSSVGSITNIAFTFKSISYDGGGWSASYQPNAATWTSPIANGEQARITKIVVTYTPSTGGGETPGEGGGEALSYTWNLSTNSYSAASADQVTWSSTDVNMVVDKGTAGTAPNNYLGGDANSRTSSRFYQNSILTITPEANVTITSVVFTATSDSYATALSNSTWTNADATASSKTVTVTPTNGASAISATISATCGFTGVTVNYTKTSSGSTETVYSVTLNQPANGTISAEGLTDGKAAEGVVVKLTATPDAGYKWESWTVTGASGDVAVSNNQFTMPAEDVTVTASFVAKEQYTIKWNVAEGSVEDSKVYEGDALGTLPDAPNCSEGKVFVGWTEATSVNPDGSGITYAKATDIPNGNKEYNAVYAASGGTATVIDELTQSWTGITGTSYTAWENKTSNSSAVYAGQSAAGNSSIQLRSNNNNSGIITTTSGGKVKKVVVTWNTAENATASGRTLNVYGKNSAYSAATDLYAESTAGTSLGTIVCGTSTELAITGDYEYIGLRSASGAMYLTKIEITWEATNYSDYSLNCNVNNTPFLTVDETPIDFGTVAQNETVTETLSVSGGYLAEDVTLTISGANASFFSVNPTTIAKADEIDQDVTITYNPTATGNHTATLTIKSSEKTKTVALSGTVLAPGKWVLVKNVTELSAGDEVIIASSISNYAIGTAASSNYKGAAITKVGETANATADVTILTIEETGVAEAPYAFKTNGKYLYAASSSANQLKAQATNNTNGQWAVAITEGVASIVAAKSSNRNVMQCNPNGGSPIFACYSSASYEALAIYRNSENVVKPVISGEADFVGSTQVTITAQSGLTVYYTTDGNTPDKTSNSYSAPFTINATTTVKAIAYDATDNASAVAEMTFTKHDLVNVATAMALEKDEIAYFDEFEVVKVVAGKGNIYIKDASGHGLIYDFTLAGQLKDGDRVKGFVGISSPYSGLPEAKPYNVTYEDLTITAGTAALPYDFTSTIIAEKDVNKYIVFQNVEIVENTDMSTDPTLTIGGNSVDFYNQFGVSKTLEAGKIYDIYGFVAIYNGSLQVYFYEAPQDGEVIQKYTVTYNAGGATGTVPVDNAEYSEGAEVYLKSALSLTYEGYEYKGWKVTDANGTEISVSSNKFNMPASNVTVTAQWEAIVVTPKEDFSAGVWVLVTDMNELAADDYIIVAAAEENFAMKSYESGNNCKQVAITKFGNNNCFLTWTEEIGVFQLLANGSNYTIQDVNTKQYLYAAGSGNNNYLKASNDIATDENASKYVWTIAVDENGIATVKATSENRNTLMYNTGSDLFSCYASGQKDIVLYKYVTDFYTRDVETGNLGTICLPYASSKHAGATFYEIAYLEMNGTDPNRIYLDEVEGGVLEAGKPYIFQATSNKVTVAYEGEASSLKEGVKGLVGILEDSKVVNGQEGVSNILTGNYVISGTKFYTCGTGCSIYKNRAYIDASIIANHTTPVAEMPGRRRIAMGAAGENQVTGVDNTLAPKDNVVKVIENGQLIIIRDGVKYNVQGQKL